MIFRKSHIIFRIEHENRDFSVVAILK